MRLPYIQIAMELVEQVAPDISVELDTEESSIGWGLVKGVKWMLGRCPDNAPPSHNDVVRGQHAARLIARACGYQGDPDAFVDAGERCRPALFQRVPDGVRWRGLNRYDAAWGKNHPDAWKAIQAAKKQDSSGPAPSPDRNRSEPGPSSGHQTQTQTQIQTKEEAPPPTPSAEFEPLEPVVVVRKVGDRAFETTPDGLWACLQYGREVIEREPERNRPKGWKDWAKRELARAGFDAIWPEYGRYLNDASIRAPGHPTAVFMTIWDSRQEGSDGHQTDPPAALPGPHVEKRTHGQAEVATA